MVVVKDGPSVNTNKTKLAMEFIRLIPHCSKKAFEADNVQPDTCMGKLRHRWAAILICLNILYKVVIKPMATCWCKRSPLEAEEEATVAMMEDPKKRRPDHTVGLPHVGARGGEQQQRMDASRSMGNIINNGA